jgi:hypothetical protein
MVTQPLHTRADHIGVVHQAARHIHIARQAMVEAALKLDAELHEAGHGDRQAELSTGGGNASTGNTTTG